MEHISPKFMKLFRIRNALVTRISVKIKEYNRVGGSNASRIDNRVSMALTSIWWEMCPTTTRQVSASD